MKRTTSAIRRRSENRRAPASPTRVDRATSRLRRRVLELVPGEPVDVEVRYTRNTSTLASRSIRGSRVTLRVQEVFREAPDELLELLVDYLFQSRGTARAREARRRLIEYAANSPALPARRRRARPPAPPGGKHHDLELLRDELITLHFPELANREPPAIGWTRRIQRRVMGKWVAPAADGPGVIHINRLLDRLDVPELYLRYVVYHELLHELLPSRFENGRWIRHSPEFREREKKFPGFQAARDWERDHLEAVHRSARHES